MKIKSFLVLSLWVFIASTSRAELKLVLNTTGKPPLNDQYQSGFMDRVTNEAFKRIGIKLVTIQLPAERGLLNVNAGIDDGEMSRVAGLEKIYPNLIRIPEKIMDWEFVVFSKKRINIDKGWESLKSHAVSVINGWKILENNMPDKANLIKVKNPLQLFGLLQKDRVDLVIYERWGGMAFLMETGIKDVHIVEPQLIKKEMFIYLHKKHKNIAQKIDGALKDIKRDGTYKKIKHEILDPYR